MLETSGTYKEKTVHTGTFAQEIITLVHHVKEHYFRGDSITLNERFSAPQEGGLSEEEMMELTLDQRFTSHRSVTVNLNLLIRKTPPVRGPGDLRHDLERRRQERLEGVKVTIPGSSSTSQRPGFSRAEGIMVSFLGLFFFHYVDQIDFTLPNTNKHLNFPIVWFWSQRKGVSHGQNTGFQGRNNRFSNRVGPMRRQNNHINNKD
uniref:Uncharacterized protein n=1 Tax=Cynoglossus semilaevis TaxID=244447 RepID=A0A3P8WED5_CYNSE